MAKPKYKDGAGKLAIKLIEMVDKLSEEQND